MKIKRGDKVFIENRNGKLKPHVAVDLRMNGTVVRKTFLGIPYGRTCTYNNSRVWGIKK